MASKNKEFDIVIYGATGFTGFLVRQLSLPRVPLVEHQHQLPPTHKDTRISVQKSTQRRKRAAHRDRRKKQGKARGHEGAMTYYGFVVAKS